MPTNLGFTNKGVYEILNDYFRTGAKTFWVALVTAVATPEPDINTFGELDEIQAGNGYVTGGFELNSNVTDFPTIDEDDANDLATVISKLVSWVVTAGNIPASGQPARWVVLLLDDGVVTDRKVVAFGDLGQPVTMPTPNSISLTLGLSGLTTEP